MAKRSSSEQGFSLVEVIVATGVMSVGLLGAAAVLGMGLQRLGSSPNDVVAVQKAAEAVESVFSARDSHKLTWSQLRNAQGQSGSDGGVFLDGFKQLKLAGTDGLVNTTDDGVVETVTLPGYDQLLGTADDRVVSLANYQREITIRDIPNEPVGCGTGPDPCMLRSVTVTVTYPDGKATKSYTLTTYISSYS
ncbi:MAG: prepilin-type N-terminal cleavage/methylation domain-containing protein [Vicinamibacterales bacterium]